MAQQRRFLVLALGVALLTGIAAYDAHRYINRMPAASSVAVNRPLMAFAVDPAWIHAGVPNFRGSETARSADGHTITGLWSCDGPSIFEWHFAFDETVHLLEGEIEVDYQGHRFTLRPGDTATFHTGTRAVWHVKQYSKKAYTLHRPGRLVLLWRWLADRWS